MKESLIQLLCAGMGLLSYLGGEMGSGAAFTAASLVIWALEPTRKDKQ